MAHRTYVNRTTHAHPSIEQGYLRPQSSSYVITLTLRAGRAPKPMAHSQTRYVSRTLLTLHKFTA